jgi:hypothetical protein
MRNSSENGGKAMKSRTSGALVYWNAHTGFGEIDLDSRIGLVGIYRADLLRAGVRKPQIGDRFQFNIGIAANGVTAAIDLCWMSEGQCAA